MQHTQRSVKPGAFANPAAILGLDLASSTLARDVVRAKKRMVAEVDVSHGGKIDVNGHTLDRQMIIQMADALADPANVALLQEFQGDEPLREFLSSGDATWAGRVRVSDYYTTDAFHKLLLPPLREAVRQAITDCWKDDEEQGFARTLRLIDHIPASNLCDEVESFLDGHIRHLTDLAEEVEEGNNDPADGLLPTRVREHVRVRCLNALPSSLASYRATFYGKVREITLTCHNDFDCTRVAVGIFELVEELSVDERQARQRSEDITTLRHLEADQRLEQQYRGEMAEINKACKRIETVKPRAAVRDADRVKLLIPVAVLNTIPAMLRGRAADRLATAFLALSTTVWNEVHDFAVSDKLLQLTMDLPLTDAGKQLIAASHEGLLKAWRDGLEDKVVAIDEAMQKLCAAVLVAARSPGQTVNKSAITDAILKMMDFMPAEELCAANREGIQVPILSLLRRLKLIVPLLSSFSSTIEWVEPLAAELPAANDVLNALRERKQQEERQQMGCLIAAAVVAIVIIAAITFGS